MGQFRLTFNEKTCGDVNDLERNSDRIFVRQQTFQLKFEDSFNYIPCQLMFKI